MKRKKRRAKIAQNAPTRTLMSRWVLTFLETGTLPDERDESLEAVSYREQEDYLLFADSGVLGLAEPKVGAGRKPRYYEKDFPDEERFCVTPEEQAAFNPYDYSAERYIEFLTEDMKQRYLKKHGHKHNGRKSK